MISCVEPTAAGPYRIGELQQTISASRLNAWLGCRLKFYFRYVLQLKKPPTASLHAGSTAHVVLQQWNMSRWRREPFQLARFEEVFGSLGAVVDIRSLKNSGTKSAAERAQPSLFEGL